MLLGAKGADFTRDNYTATNMYPFQGSHSKYRDNTHMYYPCTEIDFLNAIDTITKENINVAAFKEHRIELIQIAMACVQSSSNLRSLFEYSCN